jgi:hypothetical protein
MLRLSLSFAAILVGIAMSAGCNQGLRFYVERSDRGLISAASHSENSQGSEGRTEGSFLASSTGEHRFRASGTASTEMFSISLWVEGDSAFVEKTEFTIDLQKDYR